MAKAKTKTTVCPECGKSGKVDEREGFISLLTKGSWVSVEGTVRRCVHCGYTRMFVSSKEWGEH